MEIEGKLILDLGEQSGTSRNGNPWRKKEYVLETFGQYPKKVKFTVFGEQRCQSILLEVGKDYSISYDIDSREFNGRWYTDINCFAAREISGQTPVAPGYGAPAQQGYGAPAQPGYVAPAAPAYGGGFQGAPAAPAAPAADPLGGNDSDDLPF